MEPQFPKISPNPESENPSPAGKPVAPKNAVIPPLPPDELPAPAQPPPSAQAPRARFAIPEKAEANRLKPTTVLMREASAENEEILLQPAPEIRRSTWKIAEDRFEKWFVLLLFFFATLTVLLTLPFAGMAWDEAYYADAAQRTCRWFAAFSDPKVSPWQGDVFRQAWDTVELEPRGHASVTRLLAAISMRICQPYGINPLFAMRIPFALCYGLTLMTLYLLMRTYYGRVTGWLTALAYFFMPHVFGHAHFALTETPSTLFTVLTIYAFLQGLEKKTWSLLSGVFLGLAFATKATAILLPAILLPWTFLFHRQKSLNNLYSMLFVAPITMIAVWPWLWKDGPAHFFLYMLWNVSHFQTAIFYFDQLYNSFNPPVPWHYVPRMIAFTLPLVTLFLGIFGVARSLTERGQHRNVGLLLLWAALLPCLVQMMPTSPKYDGIRLFIGAFPFLAAMTGIGGAILVRVAAYNDTPASRFPKGPIMLTILVIWLIIEGGMALLKSQPYFLTYYNPVGNVLLKDKYPFQKVETAFWGEALSTKDLNLINDMVPDGATLTTRAMNFEVLRDYQKWGMLKPGIRLMEDYMAADFHLLQYRRSFFTTEDWFLVEKRSCTLLKEFGPKDAPCLGLYKTGAPFLEFCQRSKGVKKEQK